MAFPTTHPSALRSAQPWQLKMFQHSLKKQQKLDALLETIGPVTHEKCLLVTCGDNNGALNWHFRVHGGSWTWCDLIEENLIEMSELLAEPVLHTAANRLPFADSQFDCVVSIDVLEHLDNDQPFLGELRRVVRSGGRVIVTVPNGDPRLLANRIKWRLGMTPDVYGHTRAGYTITELNACLNKTGLTPVRAGGYSRFFTEMMELVINFGYAFVLTRRKKHEAPGRIAPTSSRELKTHRVAYWAYTLAFPIMQLVSNLDRLLPARIDNAVIVSAVRLDTEVAQ